MIDETGARLVAALDDTATGMWMNQDAARQGDRTWGHIVADALLPVVRSIVAAELRAAADAVSAIPYVEDAQDVIRSRANALEPK